MSVRFKGPNTQVENVSTWVLCSRPIVWLLLLLDLFVAKGVRKSVGHSKNISEKNPLIGNCVWMIIAILMYLQVVHLVALALHRVQEQGPS